MVRFKFLGNIFQKRTDGQMLGTDSFALAAADAVGGLSAALGADIVIVVVRIPVMVQSFGIQAGKKIRNGNMFRTAVGTVAAGGTGYRLLGF